MSSSNDSLFHTDFSDESLLTLKSALADAGFDTYSTLVGGSGFGVLPHGSTDVSTIEGEGGAATTVLPDGVRFKEATGVELAEWAEKVKGWSYV